MYGRRNYANVVPSACNTALENSSTITRFYTRTPVQFLFLPRICFLLFHALYSFPTFIPCHTLLFLLISLRFFTMGGNVRATTLCLRSQHIFLFVVLIFRRAFINAALYSLAALRVLYSKSSCHYLFEAHTLRSLRFYRRYFIFAGRTPNFIFEAHTNPARGVESRNQLLFARVKFVAPRGQLLFLLHNSISRRTTILSYMHKLLSISKLLTTGCLAWPIEHGLEN